jgi:glycosyltransferase involved in cell wall biosynthesis
MMVAHDFPPRSLAGTELYTYQLAQELRRRGHTVRVFCAERDPQRPELEITEDVYGGLPVTRLTVHRSPDLTGTFKNEAIGETFDRYLARLAVDVVHVQHLIGLSASILHACARQGVPTVMTLHDGWSLCEQSQFLRSDGSFCTGPETLGKCVQCVAARWRLEQISPEQIVALSHVLALRRDVIREAIASLAALVVPTRFLQQVLAYHGLEHPRTVVAPLGLTPFRALPWHPTCGPLRVAFLGNIVFTKGVDLLVRALGQLDPHRVRLDLYGAIKDAAYWRGVSAGIKPGFQVEYHGAYTRDELPAILARTDIGVLPSRAENFPTVLRECLHAGVPVIGPDVGGVPEIIEDGVNGLLFRPGDQEDLARKLGFFVQDRRRVLAFRRRIGPVRTISDDATQLEALYGELVARRGAGSR